MEIFIYIYASILKSKQGNNEEEFLNKFTAFLVLLIIVGFNQITIERLIDKFLFNGNLTILHDSLSYFQRKFIFIPFQIMLSLVIIFIFYKAKRSYIIERIYYYINNNTSHNKKIKIKLALYIIVSILLFLWNPKLR